MKYASLMSNWQNALPSLPQAVNMFFHNGAESGIVGLVLILLILGLTIKTFAKTWVHQRQKDIERKKILIFFVIGISILLHNQFEFLFSYGHNSFYAVMVVIFLGLVLFYAPESEFIKLSPKIFYPLIIIALIPVLIAVDQIWAGYDLYENGLNSINDGNLLQAKEQMCAAVEENPDNAFLAFQCSLAYARLAYEDNNHSYLNKAIDYQKMGLALDPVMAINWLNLGILQWEIGDQNEALESMRHASEIDAQSVKYRDPTIKINLARVEAELGYENDAAELYKQALETDPLIGFNFSDSGERYQVDVSEYLVEQYGSDMWEGEK